jgi:C4-dicarboxylate-specific signal transduction histidine kinase
MNLINNAYDALTDTHEPWIAIDAAEKDGRIRIRVTDSGPGVPSAVVDRLMEPFFTTKDVGKGTGLGLSLSKGIAEAHHGHLRYDAKAAHTCFELELPVSSTARAAAQRSA